MKASVHRCMLLGCPAVSWKRPYKGAEYGAGVPVRPPVLSPRTQGPQCPPASTSSRAKHLLRVAGLSPP